MPTALRFVLSIALLAAPCAAQVHYFKDGRPWSNRARSGPDASVPGWFYNLGISGIRVELTEDAPRHLLVRHVFDGSPAHKRVQVGDWITGAGGAPFAEEHQNGYGTQVFGARGPISAFAAALEHAQTKEGRGKLELSLLRDGEAVSTTLDVGRTYGAFTETFPADCPKSDRMRRELLDWLVEEQQANGSFGNPVHNTFAPLALLTSTTPAHRKAVERCARFHASTTHAKDDSSLINWRYMAAAIVLSEYHLATGERWVLDELQEVYDFLMSTQYVDMAQIDPRSKESHPGSYPKSAADAYGGWGHNPGFEGYGPICMLTGQGALAFALMARCGIEVDRERHDAAFEFCARGTGPNGYVWYEDEVGNPDGWADHGRTGAAGLANWVSTYEDERYRSRAAKHAAVIGAHPESFPDTHGSPVMGMGYAAACAAFDPDSFRRLMDANRWWFALAPCGDRTCYYQPNRDNAGYGDDARMSASAVVAFILSIPKKNLVTTGR
ncbi:MAG: DUF6288 domain-containing protein [Planctomycetota bacterium]